MNAIWDDRLMNLAHQFASWSKDPECKVGAVIIDQDRRIIGAGYNGFPRAVIDAAARYNDKPLRLKLSVHAEANAILNANASVRHCTLYCTKAPCTECVKLIIQSGIAVVVSPPYSADGHWAEDGKFASQMLAEAAVDVRYL